MAVVRTEALGRGCPVEASEQLSQVLSSAGLAHSLPNASQDADEAARIAEAAQPARITVATNMAGRGTDIGVRGKHRFVVTTDSEHSVPLAPNLLQWEFTAEAPI